MTVNLIGRTFQECLLNLQRLKLNPEKCQLFQKEVQYLQHVVSPEEITTDPEKLRASREWPTPKNKKEIRSFLGLCTYYRRFISGFANVLKPLTKPTEEKQAFQWTAELKAAFRTLKESLCTALIFAYRQPVEWFVVDTDSSDVGIGGVLSQVQDGQEQVVYYSKPLNKAERNHCATRREILVIVGRLEHSRKYLYGQEIHLRTDLSALTWLMSFKNLEGQTARWIQRLQEYSFISEHHYGRKQQFRCPFATIVPRRVYSLPESRGAGRRQAGTIYCGYSRNRLRSSLFQNGTTVRQGHRTHSGGNRDRTAPRMERHRRLQTHVQKLLSPVDIPRVRNDVLERHWETADER
jgi:hypothetical protein